MSNDFNQPKTVVEKRKLSPCISLIETRTDTDIVRVIHAELSAKHWPDDIVITHDGWRFFWLQSDMSLPAACSGRFDDIETAYAQIVDHLSVSGCEKHDYQLALAVPDMLTKEQELDLKEKSSGPVVNWSDHFRLGRVYVTEARLSDGGSMAKLEVRDADEPILHTVSKPLDVALYHFEGDVPQKLSGAFTGVRSAASALSSFLSQEGL